MTSATVRGKLMVGSGGRVPRTTNRCAVSGTGVTPLVFDFPEPSVQSLAPMRQLVGGGASLESTSCHIPLDRNSGMAKRGPAQPRILTQDRDRLEPRWARPPRTDRGVRSWRLANLLRSDDTDAPCGTASGPWAAGSDDLLTWHAAHQRAHRLSRASAVAG